MKNSKLIKKIIKKLEKNHINLYHDVSKEEVANHIAKINNINELNEIQFDYEMLKLFALFKDAHTTYFLSKNVNYNYKFLYLDKILYLNINDKYLVVKKINSVNFEEIIVELEKLINYETKEWLNVKLNKALNNGYFYKIIGIDVGDGVIVELDDGDKIKLECIDKKAKNDKRNYGYSIIDNNILHIEYRKCINHEDYPFSQMVEEIREVSDCKKVKKYILDLRGNTGGSSKIIEPLENFIEETGLQGIVLINNEVFSSGRFAAADFKEKFQTLLVGESTGGAARSYGYNKILKVKDKNFCCSIRLWDFSHIFGYTGSIKPDIEVKTTIKDIENKYDRVLDEALKILNKKDK